MKRKLKRLFYTHKFRLIIYLLGIVVFLVSSLLFSITLIKLSGIETTIRIVLIFLIAMYFIYYIYKGYIYIVNKNKVKYTLIIIITFILSLILAVAFYFIDVVYGEIGNLTDRDTTIYTGYLITLKDTTDINYVGMINNEDDIEGYKVANKIIKENKLKYNIITK